jgi:hypothetical protein
LFCEHCDGKVREELAELRQQLDGAAGMILRRLDKIDGGFQTTNTNQEKIMTALADLQAADASLKAEVATFLTDVATALSAADPDIESVVSDINSEVSALQAADPVTGTAATAASGTAAPVATPPVAS